METLNGPDFQNHSEAPSTAQAIYYSVYIPPDTQADVDPYRNIFKDKHEALCIARTYKKARFKSFAFYHEAVDFAMKGQTYPESAHDDVNQHKGITHCEKPVAFRGPKSQDLVKLRKAIETGALTVVETAIWDNPRYLISSGDTPSILQEGSRYNALHVAAKCKNRNMCELILNTISNVSFVMLLYGDDDNQDLQERSKILLDLYLNTPDKGLNETPLHFAVKFAAVEVVELLVSYPQCDRNVRNKFGKLPNQIVCERCDSASSNIKNKITMLLEDAFYVPVLRSEDNCIPPLIGEPFAPSSPPVFNEDPLLPQIEIHAYAGPMSKEAADKFRRVWKTPPRSLKQKLQCKDLEKGLERVGRNLAEKHDVGWKEYWTFLDDFIDIGSLEGLQRLEKYLATKVLLQYSDDSCTNTNSSIGSNVLSPISDLCKDLESCKLSDSSHSKRIQTAKTRIGDNPGTCNFIPDQWLHSQIDPNTCIEKACDVFAHRISNNILNLLESDYNKTTYSLLEADIAQLECSIASFMADSRFDKIDYRFVHHRVGTSVVTRLKECLLLEDEVMFVKRSLELWLEMYTKEFDYFSSDDECGNYRQDILNHNSKKHTSKNKQVICLLQHILSALLVDERTHGSKGGVSISVQAWIEGKPCDCIWPKSSYSRRNLNKLLSRNFCTSEENSARQRLFVNGSDVASPNNETDCDILLKRRKISLQFSDSEEESDADVYKTALTSQSCTDDSDLEDDVFEDSLMPVEDIFIEGCIPTKMDYAVYNAVTCGKQKLNANDYPNIYKWYHAISLYPETERQNWGSSNVARCRINSQGFTTLTPTKTASAWHNVSNTDVHHSPSNPWLQRIGLASPQHSLKVFKPNISFNL